MKKPISLLTLGADSVQSAQQKLEQLLKNYGTDTVSENLGSAAELADAVKRCACDGRLIVAAVPCEAYFQAKTRIIKIFSSKIISDKAIIQAMGSNAPQNEKEKLIFSAIPENSLSFVTEDGRYSAFAKEYNGSEILFMPLDEAKIDVLCAAGLSDFLSNELAGKTPKKPSIAQVRESVEKVIASGKTVAVSPCASAKAMMSVLAAVPDSDDAFFPCHEQRDMLENENIEEYIADNARLSKEKMQTDLGICISEVSVNENGEEYVTVCVSDSERAKVARVFALPDEGKKYLMAAAVIQLCSMLEQYSGPAGLVNPDKKEKKNPRLPLIISIVSIAVAIVICLIVAVITGVRSSDAALANADSSVTAGEQEGSQLNAEDNLFFGGSGLDGADFGAVEIIPSTAENPSDTDTRTTLTVFSSAAGIIETLKETVSSVKQTETEKSTTEKKTTTTTEKKTTTTTKKPTTTTTTRKPTTTTTTKPTTTTTTRKETLKPTPSAADGKFVFTVYGYGHGVGMSQHGAMDMANNGKNYEQILNHYFPGTTVKQDTATPLTIKYGGKDVPIDEYLCKTTKQEMGYSSAHPEALKAQIIAIYTFAKDSNFNVPRSKHAYNDSFDFEGTKIHSACLAVLSMTDESSVPTAYYVDYNGSAAFTCYFSTSAGKTASSASVWGGNQYPYLTGGISSPEDPKKNVTEFTASEVKELIEAYAKKNGYDINLGDDPAEWLEIISHDSCRGASCGYVTKIRVGNYEMRGNAFRASVMDYKIRSHCFTVEYIPS